MQVQKYDIDYHNLEEFIFEGRKYETIDSLREALKNSKRTEFIVLCPDSKEIAEEKFEELSNYFERIYTPIKWLQHWDSYCTIKI